MSIVVFLALIVFLIIGHELGHLLAAKRAGMSVPEFGIGFPPKLWSTVIGRTEYSVNAFLFGGFVRIEGEDGDATHPSAFRQKSKLAQAGVIVAGPAANIVIAFIAFWIAFMIGIPTPESEAPPHGVTNPAIVVTAVLPGSPAALAGVRAGDTLQSVTQGGFTVPLERPTDLSDAVMRGAPIELTGVRDGMPYTYALTPETGIVQDEPELLAIGVMTVRLGLAAYDPLTALVRAAEATLSSMGAIVVGFGSLVYGAFVGSASLESVAGPVGIASMTGTALQFGVGQVLAFMALISLNLGILNLLPFPALDGGRLAVIGYEAARGREVRTETAQLLNALGFSILIVLMVVVTWNDILRVLGS